MMSREKLLFNDGWEFTKQKIGTSIETIKSENIIWNKVEIPHDWLIYDTLNLYETSEGWYRKKLIIEKKYNDANKNNANEKDVKDQIISISFDGVYMNSTVYINDQEVGVWRYGYSSFEYDVTKYLKLGTNTIMVQVKHEAPNSRWYSGAGIYRNVWLKKTAPIHIETGGIYIVTDGAGGNVTIQTEVINKDYQDGYVFGNDYKNKTIKVKQTILNKENNVVAETTSDLFIEKEKNILKQKIKVQDPILWDLETCYLYTLNTKLYLDKETIEEIIDEEKTSIGFRIATFDPNEGFYLNGDYLKIHGVCLHHDLGSLGSALNKIALERQLRMMKDMGANAIRTSHNMPAPELVEICDRIGLLVVSEAFDMWELSKTEYDHARFFNETCKEDVASWIRRDRNHPCIIMWSIGNEIYDTHVSSRGIDIAKRLKGYVLEHDPNQNAVVTIGSNYIPWENAQKVAEELKYSGYNYGEHLYDEHHEKYPDWIIYGSETASTVKSRGIYHFPANTPILMHDDLQCSSLDNSTVAWGGKNAEQPWINDRDRKFCAGQFVWTGFDYIGEPTPYSTKNSYFGLVDTAGIPKDIYYMYQAEWTDYKTKPMVHLLPYWDFNLGQTIDVIAYSNAPKIELFYNGESQGIQNIDHKRGKILHGIWRLTYQAGILEIKAYDENNHIIAYDSTSSFKDAAKIILKPDKNELQADGRDLLFVEISTIDESGNYVANARNRVNVEVKGAGRLVGLDNGDSTDYDSYKGTNRRLFSGKLIAVIKSRLEQGDIEIKVTSRELQEAKLIVRSLPTNNTKGINVVDENQILSYQHLDEIPVRKIDLVRCDDNVFSSCSINKLTKEQSTATVVATILPKNATYSDLEWKVVNNNGIETNIALLEINDRTARVTAIGNGEFRLRCSCRNGGEVPQIISELEFEITGQKETICNPYQFISAQYFNLSNVPLNIIKEGAISGFHERTYIGFENIDFGAAGADMIKLYIGNSGDNSVPVELWEGMPGDDDAKMIAKLMFDYNGEWDGFKPNAYKLPERLLGMKTISFVIEDKIIFGGFEFVKVNQSYKMIDSKQYKQVYGDTFQITDNAIEQIGNNVVLEYEEMEFGVEGANKIVICGKTPNKNNTIQIRSIDRDGKAVNQVIEFPQVKKYEEKEFRLDTIVGTQRFRFVFLPGSNFDFKWFQFKYE